MKTRMILMVVCVGMLAGTVGAEAPLADRVSPDALVYIGWAGTGGAAFDRSTFGQLLNEPAFEQILTTIKGLAEKNIRDKDKLKAFTHGWAMAGIVLHRPIAVAWTGLHETRRDPIPTGAVLIDLGKDKKAFARHLDDLIDIIPPEARAKIAKATIGNVTYRTVRERNAPEVSFGYMGNVFFLTIGPGSTADLLAVTPRKSLAADKTFAARMKEVGGANELLSMYVDVTGIRKLVEPLIKAEMGRGDGPTPGQIFQALGLANVTAVASSTRIVNTGMTTRTKIFTPAPHRGVMMLLAGKPLAKGDLSHVPADADFVCAANVSPAKVWREVRAGIKSINPQMEQGMLAGVAKMEKTLGLSLEQDILGNLGDTWVISSAESQGGFITGTVITLDLKNPREFAIAAGKIEAFFEMVLASKKDQAGRAGYTCPMHPQIRGPRAGQCPNCRMNLVEVGARRAKPGPSIETVKIGGTEIRYVALPIGPIPVAPSWAIHKNRLYIAGFPQVLQAAIENDGKNPLVADAEFVKYRAMVGRDVSMLSYVNTPKLVSKVYNFILLVWTVAANTASSETPFAMKPDWLPALSKLTKYLTPSVSAVSSDKTGITFERHGSLPFGGLLGGLGPMATAVALPALTSARRTAKARQAEVRREVEELRARDADRRGPKRPDGDF